MKVTIIFVTLEDAKEVGWKQIIMFAWLDNEPNIIKLNKVDKMASKRTPEIKSRDKVHQK